MKVKALFYAMSLLPSTVSAVLSIDAVQVTPAGPFDGWNIMQDQYENAGDLDDKIHDGLSLEWEYFMIHDDDAGFSGIIGYVLADPRGRLGGDDQIGEGLIPDLMPTGMNIAIAGKWADGTMVSNFVNFGPDEMAAGKTKMTGRGGNPENSDGSSWCTIDVGAGGDEDKLTIKGVTGGAAWDLKIGEDWKERSGLFHPQRGTDVGVASELGFLGYKEHWTVNMIWPRTTIEGSMTNLATGEPPIEIHGHGYRENSWGRWTFVTDGWDFAILSDSESKVQWAWQSYHKSDQMDFLDVSFYEGDELRAVQFKGEDGELGWSHSVWSWNEEASQCAPGNAHVEAENDDYKVTADIVIGDSQVPLLSDATPVTDIYAIMEWVPHMSGKIVRKSDDTTIEFSGIAGGEISFVRELFSSRKSDKACHDWGAKKFHQELTYGKDEPSIHWFWRALGGFFGLFGVAGILAYRQHVKAKSHLYNKETEMVDDIVPSPTSFDIYPDGKHAVEGENPMVSSASAV